MMREILSLLITLFLVYLFLVITFQKTVQAHTIPIRNSCSPSSCGNLHNISSPFRLKTDPQDCGNDKYELSCEDNHTVLEITEHHKLHVMQINYNNYTIRVIDLDFHKENCFFVPEYSLTKDTFLREGKFETIISYNPIGPAICNDFLRDIFNHVQHLTETAIFLSCEKPIRNSHRLYNSINRSHCMDNDNHHGLLPRYSYVVLDGKLGFSDLEESCRVDKVTQVSSRNGLMDLVKKKGIVASYRDQFLYGFELSWVQAFSNGTHYCYVNEKSNKVHCFNCEIIGYLGGPSTFLKFELITRIVFIIPLIVILVDKWRKRHLSMYDGVEEFLQNHNNSMPVKYMEWEINKMTNGFKDKLGEGGFGMVYKGKLSNGHLVAVKLLGKSKSNGQDFINEVSTIGRVHHVNVVQLIGFFVKGSKRALIYDYMSNGSLDKYIFPREGVVINKSLSPHDLFHISLGVARGIEYLHRGCSMKILHFDIKPHNILLDENFNPKVSDFGLARVFPSSDKNSLFLTAARGTIGYIAPELFYRNIGGVSHKSDVYSFGMLLMEIANKRKNINANAENSSQVYFPLWIYDQFSKGNDIEIEDFTADELQVVKKMIIVALWCIQLKPNDRPSMSKVIEMLEDEVENLRIPPRPCLYPQEQEHEKDCVNDDLVFSSSMSSDECSAEISLISNAH